MAWQNAAGIQAQFRNNLEFIEAFRSLYSLVRLLSASILKSGFRPPDSIADAIAITSAGNSWAERLRNDHDEASIRLALLVNYDHQDIYVDPLRTDQTRLLAIELQVLARAHNRLALLERCIARDRSAVPITPDHRERQRQCRRSGRSAREDRPSVRRRDHGQERLTVSACCEPDPSPVMNSSISVVAAPVGRMASGATGTVISRRTFFGRRLTG